MREYTETEKALLGSIGALALYGIVFQVVDGKLQAEVPEHYMPLIAEYIASLYPGDVLSGPANKNPLQTLRRSL